MMLRILLCAVMALVGCASDLNTNPSPDATPTTDAQPVDASERCVGVTMNVTAPESRKVGEDLTVSVTIIMDSSWRVLLIQLLQFSNEVWVADGNREGGQNSFKLIMPNFREEAHLKVQASIATPTLICKIESEEVVVPVYVPPVNHGPVVAIVTPIMIVEGKVKVHVTANDPDGNSVSVRLYVDGANLFATGLAPLMAELMVADLASGGHTLFAKGDDDGDPPAVGQSDLVTFTIP